jgi:Topoisomerase 6 subunit A/Spo11, Toprim domain/Histidine kinase-, DNA gyrase B-, and HSP90-like ATPase
VSLLENPSAGLASQDAPQILEFQREDWWLFRTLDGLQQRAGVPKSKLRRLVLKELADNGLDAGAKVRVGENEGGFFVEDDGPGIDPDEVADLFSISRPMASSKLWRLPTRGALGNGLRVVAGAVLASQGKLTVMTRNRRIELRPERDGSTTVTKITPVDFPVGTRVEISFGKDLPEDSSALSWARAAINFWGKSYNGKTSPWWYDAAAFHELLSAAGPRPVRELVANLDGCSGARAGEIVAEAKLGRALCESVTRAQSDKLLTVARANARQASPTRLIGVGEIRNWEYAYQRGTAHHGEAYIPYLVEVWATSSRKTTLEVCVNRTPVTAEVGAYREKRDINIYGCEVYYRIAEAPKDKHFSIELNIITPYMPITSDGKAPNLQPFLEAIARAISSAVRKAHIPNSRGESIKAVVLDNLSDAIAKVSNDGQYRFNQRQILYALRPTVMAQLHKELTTENFTQIITDYENEHGEIAGMYREPRGSIYHPHERRTITLGTLMVESYERPEWKFNKLVYIEKEGFLEALKDEGWPERHDCAVLSSKGFSTRAARDLIDKLAEDDEPITVFCVHDADAHGTIIYQTLQEATKARGARKVTIINLGLEPWEAVDMDLEIEPIEEKDRQRPVADYVPEQWREWLQTHRVELNAMTTPQFIAWLDGKMAEYDKLIPPAEVLKGELTARIAAKIRADVTERILREARLEEQVAAATAAIEKPDAGTLKEGIERLFEQAPGREWRDHIAAVVAKLVGGNAP